MIRYTEHNLNHLPTAEPVIYRQEVVMVNSARDETRSSPDDTSALTVTQ